MRYYDLMANWPRVEPHLTHPRVQETLVRDFGRFVANRYGRTFLSHQLPADFEVVDWHPKHTGPEPPFWRLVLVGGCRNENQNQNPSRTSPRDHAVRGSRSAVLAGASAACPRAVAPRRAPLARKRLVGELVDPPRAHACAPSAPAPTPARARTLLAATIPRRQPSRSRSPVRTSGCKQTEDRRCQTGKESCTFRGSF